MRALLVFVFFFSLNLEANTIFTSETSGLKISVEKNNDNYTVLFDGPIPFFDDENFFYRTVKTALAIIPEGHDFTLSLNSSGGLVRSVAAISLMLEKKCLSERMGFFALSEHSCKITTYLAEGARCSSACISFYLLGFHRVAHEEAIFGFHAMTERDGFRNVVLPAQKAIDEYVFYGAEPSFLNQLAAKGVFSSIDITPLNPHELDGSNIVHEILID